MFQPKKRNQTKLFAENPLATSPLSHIHPFLSNLPLQVGPPASSPFPPSLCSRPQAERRGSAVTCSRRRSCARPTLAARRSSRADQHRAFSLPHPYSNPPADPERHGRRRDPARPRWPAMPRPRGTQLGSQGVSPMLPERATILATSRDGRSSRLDSGAPWPQLGHGGSARSGRSSHGTNANSPLLRSSTCSCPPKPPRSDPKGWKKVAHRADGRRRSEPKRRAKIR
jgi:hypothetical protein